MKECIKYIRQEAKFNIYPCQTTEEALSLVNRKKYNKIILISNAGVNYDGRTFVDQARKIIGNDVIVQDFNIIHTNNSYWRNFTNEFKSVNSNIFGKGTEEILSGRSK